METIFLVGFPGCGKSTLGAVLAQLSRRRFIDLDVWIESRCEASVSELFAWMGEVQFREIERQALLEVARSGAVVACGGGTPCHSNNMDIMNAHGITVWLTTSAERIISRLILPEHRAKRPQISHMSDREIAEYVANEIVCRTPYYRQARLRFDSTRIESAAETRETASRLAELLQSL